MAEREPGEKDEQAGSEDEEWHTPRGRDLAEEPEVEWMYADARVLPLPGLRALAAVNRSLERPGLVLIVAHGALFRALRAEMGLEPNVRTRNAWPMLCEPGTPWTLTDAA